jgi:hypothetical protein
MPTTNDLYTTVRNPLTNARTYGYLGAAGRLLPAGAHFTFIGDLVSTLIGDKRYKRRQTAALERDLLAGRIELISTPRIILRDATTAAIKVLDLNGGVLGTLDPSWGAYVDT